MEIISIIIFILLFALLLAALLATVIFLVSTIETIFIAKVPFVPIPRVVLPKIIEALKLADKSVLYDLGCGDARILLAAAEKYPQAGFIGIELVTLPFYLAKIRKFVSGRKNIRLKRKNFFKEDLNQATHVFAYLFPKVMDELLPKLEKELRSGTRLISCDFKFSKKEPVEVIDLKRKNKLASFLYVYEF